MRLGYPELGLGLGRCYFLQPNPNPCGMPPRCRCGYRRQCTCVVSTPALAALSITAPLTGAAELPVMAASPRPAVAIIANKIVRMVLPPGPESPRKVISTAAG